MEYLSLKESVCDVLHVLCRNVSWTLWNSRDKETVRDITASPIIRIGDIMFLSYRRCSCGCIVVRHYCVDFISNTFQGRISVFVYHKETIRLHCCSNISSRHRKQLPHEIIPHFLTSIDEDRIALSDVDEYPR
jgi:hypothetical protein